MGSLPLKKNQESIVVTLYKSGLSGPIIAKKLMLSATKVYETLKRKDIPTRSTSVRFNNSPLSFKFREDLSAEEHELMIAALMLYYGEGAKTGKTVDIANSSLGILKIFIKFLREICQIDEERLRFYLYCFEGQNIDEIKTFWSKALGVRLSQFTKPYVRKSSGKSGRIMAHGVLHIRYNDKRLLEKILDLCSTSTDRLINNLGRYSSGQRGQTVNWQPLWETVE